MTNEQQTLINRLTAYARDYTNTTYHEDLILESIKRIEELEAGEKTYVGIFKELNERGDKHLAAFNRKAEENDILLETVKALLPIAEGCYQFHTRDGSHEHFLSSILQVLLNAKTLITPKPTKNEQPDTNRI